MDNAIITHRYLDCDKIKGRPKKHSTVCQKRLQCGWLRFDGDGLAHCDFNSTAEKRVDQHKDKIKQKKEGE